MTLSTEEVKRIVFKLLEESEEFRYAIAAKIGLLKILEKLEQHDRKFNEVLERLDRHGVEIKKIWEKLEQHDRKFEAIHEEIKKIWEEIYLIKEDIRGIKSFMDKVSVSLEEEAREVVEWFLDKKYGLKIELKGLKLPDLEFDIYGVSGDYCVIGEATVRLGEGVIRRFLKRINEAYRKYPGIFRKQNIYVIYCLRVTPTAVEAAKAARIWILKFTEELVKNPIH